MIRRKSGRVEERAVVDPTPSEHLALSEGETERPD